MAVSLRRR